MANRKYHRSLQRNFWISIVAVVGCAAVTYSDDRPVDIDDARQRAFNIDISSQRLTAAATRTILEARLAEKVAFADRICGLTSVQSQKLQLAGRGDIKRFFDRLDSLRSQSNERPDAENEDDRVWADKLKVESAAIQRAINSGVHEEGSLFAKTLKVTLTGDQAAAYDKAPRMPAAISYVRWIDPNGEKVWIAIGDHDGVKPRMTYDIRKKRRVQRGRPDTPADDPISGTIEVTHVLGEYLSEARIVAHDMANPIAKGDAIVPRRPGVR